jgi:16S rRNA (uracil1498-N3)-methyltransferase
VSRRFFVRQPIAQERVAQERVALGPELAQRLSKVLRARAGDEITLFDGSGDDCRARIERLDARGGEAIVLERVAGPPESRTRVHLYQSITKGERFEWLIEKATELGVASIAPLITARSVVKTEGGGARSDRWRRITIEAAEQCGRSLVPEVGAPATFAAALGSAEGVLVVPFESAGDSAPNVRAALDSRIDDLFALSAVSLFIGPEGGFEDAEIAQAESTGAVIVTMGQRVLRSETAGLVAVALVMHALGELG